MRFQPSHFDLGDLTDIFSAFFGDDLFAGGPTRRRQRRGADVTAQVEIELVEAANGATRSVPFPVAMSCDVCAGSGVEPGKQAQTCETCGGSGQLAQVSRNAFGEFRRVRACPSCSGSGLVVMHPCRVCEGSGRRVEQRELAVEIPPGIHDGQRIRLSGEGHAGAHGTRSGDLYVQVRVVPTRASCGRATTCSRRST